MELFKEKKKNRKKKKQSCQKISSSSDDDCPELKDATSSKETPQKVASAKEKIGSSGTSQSSTPETCKEKKKNKSKKKGNSDSSTEEDKNDLLENGNKSKDPEPIDKDQEPSSGNPSNPNEEPSPASDGPPGLSPSPAPQIPPRRSIEIPISSEPSNKPTSCAAKAFISLYYPAVTHGLTHDLCSYYHEKSQKSISVGGAHSVVTGLDNIAMQITSLSGCLFNVRGVVAQEAADGGAHLLITGVCTPKGGFVTAFAHSVGLAKIECNDESSQNSGNNHSIEKGQNYVIQNDALSLLNGEMAAAAEQQHIQQQIEQQRQQELRQHEAMMEEARNSQQHLYAANQQSSTLLKPPGLFG